MRSQAPPVGGCRRQRVLLLGHVFAKELRHQRAMVSPSISRAKWPASSRRYPASSGLADGSAPAIEKSCRSSSTFLHANNSGGWAVRPRLGGPCDLRTGKVVRQRAEGLLALWADTEA